MAGVCLQAACFSLSSGSFRWWPLSALACWRLYRMRYSAVNSLFTGALFLRLDCGGDVPLVLVRAVWFCFAALFSLPSHGLRFASSVHCCSAAVLRRTFALGDIVRIRRALMLGVATNVSGYSVPVSHAVLRTLFIRYGGGTRRGKTRVLKTPSVLCTGP